MTKSKKITTAIIAAAAMTFSACALAACGDDKVDVNGTYTIELATTDCAGNIYLTGFMDSAGAKQTNTLVLSDGNYTLTKHVVSTAEVEGTPLGVDITITFTGTYTATTAEVTLSKAAAAEYDAEYGVFATIGQGISNDSGSTANGDKVECFGTHSYDPLDFFSSEYYQWVENSNKEVKITVNKADKTYKHVQAASSDDD